jgi:acylphosphatase
LLTAARFIVTGRVQGVGYRYFALREAQALGVAGHVRNLPDGSVEVVAEGAADMLLALGERLAEGPAFAEVAHVERVAIPAAGAKGFVIR